VLFSVTGASAAGKSTVLAHLEHVAWGVPIRLVEFDSVGVPAGADTAWRHGAVERWVADALQHEKRGVHTVLCGQVWSRWRDLEAGDPAWKAEIIDTDAMSPREVALAVEAWIRQGLAPA